MSDFERVYRDSVDFESNEQREKHLSIERPLLEQHPRLMEKHEIAEQSLKENEVSIEKNRRKATKKKPKKVHSKSRKTAVEKVQEKLS